MVAFSRRVRATPIESNSSSHTIVHDQIGEDEIQTQDIALIPQQWVGFKLQETVRVTHNTLLFRFSIDPTKTLGFVVASCILTRAPFGQDAEGKQEYINRLYTPISDPEIKGYFDLLIKVYPKGRMTQHFASLKPGDVVQMTGPIVKFRYNPNIKKNIGMIAGGTGINPMLLVIQAILKNPDDKTQISLIYANVSPDDIMLKKQLDSFATSHPNLKIFYTVDNPTENWNGGVGYISEDMVLKYLPDPSDDTVILVSGPLGMMQRVSGRKTKNFRQGELSGILKKVGYTKQMVYKF